MELTSLSVARAWRDALRGDAGLNDYCQREFGALPRLYLGVDERNLPGAADAPYVALVPFGTRGGPEADQARAVVRVAVGARLGGAQAPSEREVEYTGYARMEEELWPLVLAVLTAAGPDTAPATVDTGMDAMSRDYLELRAECVVVRDNVI